MELNDQMKGLLRDLGMALHRALTKDSDVKSITDQIKSAGYDIYLIMEANIALDRRDDDAEGELFHHRPAVDIEHPDVNFNRYDENFLASLQIKADED